ncbi:CRISPR-associated protein, Cas2 family [Methanobrevibacter olleyae]|uniref:CRISPR-associated endoribonuclease Cas2 n=1 Tax=Methanobrevibacter olleyae TaxID=294671 RepID=A0A1I4K6T4_METOL|nr:CRISPR-associated endonuclease Cas2 [Methanobrevibacter olleyae]SFL74475.1 CRISPR-associated protein, Cas2 family [Methanobrevibacter olleyae]
MYLLIVYDVSVERVSKVHKFLKTYLHWQQNSVFEGEVTSSQYYKMMDKLYNLIDLEADSIMIYEFPEKYLDKTILGIEKNPINFIL